jgi:hypothetical protein
VRKQEIIEKSIMYTEKHPPQGSNIKMKLTPGGAEYTWPVQQQDAISGETKRALYVLGFAVVFMGWIFTTLIETGDYASIDKGFHLGHLFIGIVHLTILVLIIQLARIIYLVLRPPLPASLEFTPNEIIYRSGTRRLQLEFIREGDSRSIQRTKETIGRSKNKTYVFPKKERENFTLEKTGDSLSLSIKYRGQRIEIGDTLKEYDKEWLHKFLKDYNTG